MEYLSIVAAFCSTLASLPQVINNQPSLSTFTLFLRGGGCALWAIYGAYKHEYVLMVSSLVAALFECILFFKKYYCTVSGDTVPCQPDVPTDVVSPG